MRGARTTRGAGIVIAALLSLVAAGCSVEKKRPEVTAPEVRLEVLRLTLGNDEAGYPNPFARAVGGAGQTHTLFLYDTLLWKDATGVVIPWVARDWTRSADGKEWRFTLRDDVRWQDGRPLTADDVAFTFEYVTKGPGKVGPERLGPVAVFEILEVLAEGPSQVVFRLRGPNPTFETMIAGHVPILPKHVWSEVSDPAKFQGPGALVGSGPYRLETFDQETSSYLYTANDDYFLGPPHVKRVEFVPAADQLLALRRGEIDMAQAPMDQGVPEAALQPFTSPQYGTLQAPGEIIDALHLNLTRGFPYTDLRFRQGLATALDRQDLVHRLLFDRGATASMGGLAPSHQLAAPGLPSYLYDPAKARALLDQAGLIDTDGDGMRELPGGDRFNPELLSASDYLKLAELVKEQLLGVGIDVRIKTVDLATFRSASGKGAYEMAMSHYGGLGGDPDALRSRLSSRVVMQKHDRVHGWVNPAFDELADQARVAVNEAEYKRLVQEMQRIVAAEVPMVSLFLADRLVLYDRQVFDAWYFTPGGVFGGYPGAINKQAFITGKKVGL